MPTPRFVKRFLFLYCFLIYYDPIIGCALQKNLKRAKNTCFIAECFLSEKGGTPCPPLTENHFARKNNLAELGGSPNVVDKFTSQLWSWVLVRIWNLKRNMIWNAIKDNLSLNRISLLFYCSSQPSMVHWLSSPIFPFCSSRHGDIRPNLQFYFP